MQDQAINGGPADAETMPAFAVPSAGQGKSDMVLKATDAARTSPAIDVGQQLRRDARSLQLTMDGSDNPSDRRFYQGVIANMERAADRLAELPEILSKAAEQSSRRYDEGRVEGMGAALQFALGVRDPMPLEPGEPKAWREACNAILNGVRTMRDAAASRLYPRGGVQ